MKLLYYLLLALEAIPFAISAGPVALPKNLQQPLQFSPANTPPSSLKSFNTASESDSSSDRSAKKLSFSGLSNSLKKLSRPVSDFRCHHYPRESILSDMTAYITDLMRSYREAVFGGKHEKDRMLFETCYAGYENSDVSPSIYFRELKPKQINAVEKLLKNQFLSKFPNVRIVKTSNALAIVVEDGPKLARRHTV